MQIGFIGLGNMGRPMAENLVRAGHMVRGFDTMTVHAEGVEIMDSAAATAADADIVITMLPNGAILKSVAAQIIPRARHAIRIRNPLRPPRSSRRAIFAETRQLMK